MMELQRKVYEDNDRYTLVLEKGTKNGESFVFLHLDVHKWNKSVLKEIRLILKEVGLFLYSEGHDITGFYLENNNNTKFHEMVRPLDFKIEESNNTFAGWYLEDF